MKESLVSNVTNDTTFPLSIDSNTITEPLDIFALVFMAVLFTLGVSGNLFTIYVLGFVKKSPSTTYDLMIVFLSISDLICVFVVPSIFAYATITRFRSWVFGLFGCKVLLSILPMNVTLSQGILILMSLDRYLVIANPFQRNGLSKSRTFLYIAFVIVIAILLASPRAYSLEILYSPALSMETCSTSGSNNGLMLCYASLNLLRDVVSTAIIATSGKKLKVALISSSSAMAKHGYMGSKHRCNMSYIRQAHRMLRLILIVFSMCTIPLDTFQFCVYVYFETNIDVSKNVYFWIRSTNTVLYLCQTSNAVVNVFIYGKRHRDFKRVLRKMSAMRRDLIFKIFPKSQSVYLQDEGSKNCISQAGKASSRSNRDVRVVRMVQFGFDRYMDID